MADDHVPRAIAAIALLVVMQHSALTLEQGQHCVNPAGRPGKCILFRECIPLRIIYNKTAPTVDDTRFLEGSRCGKIGQRSLVCCAGVDETSERTTLPEPPDCGIQLSDRIYGGTYTKIDEFPWTALFAYRMPTGDIQFSCGGSIINERYILTNTQCVQNIRESQTVIRIGEWDLSTAIDTEGDFRADAPIELEIEKIIPHPAFSRRTKSNDIALVRVKSKIEYSPTVQAICLPLSDAIRTRNHIGSTSWATGWGDSGTGTLSQKKQKIALTVQDLKYCAPIFQTYNFTLNQKNICAGTTAGKDTCDGDAGGPLMRQFSGAWYQLGIVSLGLSTCGTEGVPGVYTNVMEFVDWITDNIV